ncbi:MAG TPA: S1C family serine protease [Gemmataceae bacterium]|jgi:serine protease Do|nr:S1C family serine protease [Gemmataceae bacterium]
MVFGSLRLGPLALIAFLVSSSITATEPVSVPPAFDKAVPETVDDLKQIQQHVQALSARVMSATVAIRIGESSASGVIIDADGYVLTAGHVSGEPNRDCDIILSNGKRCRGRTLGANRGVDSGLIKITDVGDYPHVGMADADSFHVGSWCMALGHPNGYQQGRAAVVRLGRILEKTHDYLRTDCPLVGGDSGGPLFDMQGRVIGVHSRIGGSLTSNLHVPVHAYRENWDRMVKAEVWGELVLTSTATNAYLGVTMAVDRKGCTIGVVTPESPAQRAGIRIDDQIMRVDGALIQNPDDLVAFIRSRRPGQEVAIEVLRGNITIRIRVVLDRRPVG